MSQRRHEHVGVLGCPITVRQNNEPTVTADDQTIIAGQDFAYDVTAEDLDPDDTLTFDLDAPVGSSLPDGMTIDPELGRIRWDDALQGKYDLIVSATDGLDTVQDEFELHVLADTQPPEVEVVVSQRVVNKDQDVWIWVVATDDDDIWARLISPAAGDLFDLQLNGSAAVTCNIAQAATDWSWVRLADAHEDPFTFDQHEMVRAVVAIGGQHGHTPLPSPPTGLHQLRSWQVVLSFWCDPKEVG